MIRLSPTKLQAWEAFKAGEAYMDFDRFADVLQGKRKMNDALLRGLCVHDIIEHADRYLFTKKEKVCRESGHVCVLPVTTCEAIAGYVDKNVHDAVHEVWLEHYYDFPKFGKVKLVMRADAIQGATLHEFKTTGRRKTWLDYNNIQTACYQVALPEIMQVKYHVFLLDEANFLKDINCFEYNRMPNVEQKVEQAVYELLDYCYDVKVLWTYIDSSDNL